MSETEIPNVTPAEGLAVLHLFYQINHGAWEEFLPEEQAKAKQALADLVAEANAREGCTAYTFAMFGKADLGFMILDADVQALNALEKKIRLALGTDVLETEFTYLSMTERSEYTTTEEQYRKQLVEEEGLAEGTPELDSKLAEFRVRIEKYGKYRLYPELPRWECFCFYPMSKRRHPGQNWYAADFETRKALMGGHARVGRRYAERIKQLVTGSTGLDDWEWGVTLFAHDPFDIKAIVYEMRFDEVSHQYAEFGPFYNGLTLELPAIYERLGL
ncbi:MAG: hydrogen peroxide-dependent heme synthase [Verrucomicrobiota bacterium]